MSDQQMNESNPVNNPIQAASEIFYKPTAVFDALSVKDNWSWIPFILIAFIISIPSYLYFGIVDFDWWLNTAYLPQLEDMTPAQQDQTIAMLSPAQMQLTTSIFSVVGAIVVFAILALYFSVVSRNDDKSVQGFTDWYGAMWWTAMPGLFSGLIALVLLTLQDPGAQINASIVAPLSLAFLSGAEMDSDYFNVLLSLRLDSIWGIALTAICIMSWTNFSKIKAIVVALIPSLILIGISIIAS